MFIVFFAWFPFEISVKACGSCVASMIGCSIRLPLSLSSCQKIVKEDYNNNVYGMLKGCHHIVVVLGGDK